MIIVINRTASPRALHHPPRPEPRPPPLVSAVSGQLLRITAYVLSWESTRLEQSTSKFMFLYNGLQNYVMFKRSPIIRRNETQIVGTCMFPAQFPEALETHLWKNPCSSTPCDVYHCLFGRAAPCPGDFLPPLPRRQVLLGLRLGR